ncbi:MAG TPA: HAD family hydrolase [Candidatus Polarisedimenticolia bacterium]
MKLILFDVDGTLLDAGGSGRWAMTRAFEEVFEIPDGDPFSRHVRFDGMTDPEILGQIASNAGIAEATLRLRSTELRAAFLRHLDRRLAATTDKRALPGVVELLDRLAGVSQAAVGLLTGNIEEGARMKLACVGLGGYFDVGGFGGDAPDRAGVGQVARQRFESRLKRLIPPADVVVVGDSTEDVKAARRNGYRALAVGTGWTPKDAILDQAPDLFMEDLSDYGRAMQFIFGTRAGREG